MKTFPILGYNETPGPCPSSIPWAEIAPYEGQAVGNHHQTLERLAERGGLSPEEVYLIMTGKKLSRHVFDEELRRTACAFLTKLVNEGEIAKLSKELDAALLKVEQMRPVVEAAIAWNDVAPALTMPEANLVSAVVGYLNKIEKM